MSDMRETLREDPGNPVFLEYAQTLIDSDKLDEALGVLLSGLSHNPGYHKGRALLAKLFYIQGYTPFAIRELECLLESLPENQSIKRLLQKFGIKLSGLAGLPNDTDSRPEIKSEVSELKEIPASDIIQDTVAEVELDFDELDLLEDDGTS
ncbi:MAG: hypothetical protein KDD53_01195 [Bdellovibrionales bacterium]|nr:hypothetical protein [Bdellovibrionales bacterium]